MTTTENPVHRRAASAYAALAHALERWLPSAESHEVQLVIERLAAVGYEVQRAGLVGELVGALQGVLDWLDLSGIGNLYDRERARAARDALARATDQIEALVQGLEAAPWGYDSTHIPVHEDVVAEFRSWAQQMRLALAQARESLEDAL